MRTLAILLLLLPVVAFGQSMGTPGVGQLIQKFDTISQLVARPGTNYMAYFVRGHTTSGDDGGGEFRYDYASTAATNTGTIFAPPSGVGRYIRVLNGQPVTPQMFGAKADGTTDDTTRLRAMVSTAKDNRLKILIPKGDYKVNSGTSNVLQIDWDGAIIEGESSAGALTNAPPQRFIDRGSGTTLLIGTGEATNIIRGVTLRNVGFYSDTAEAGITLTNYAAQNNFQRIHVAGYTNGIRSHWSWGNTFFDLSLLYQKQDGILVTGNALDWRLYSAHIYYSTRDGVRIESDVSKPSSGRVTESFAIFGGSISHAGSRGLHVDTARGVRDIAVYYEGNGTNDVYFGSGANGCTTSLAVMLGATGNSIVVDGAYNTVSLPYFYSVSLTNAGVVFNGSNNKLESHPYFCKTLGSGASVTFTSGSGTTGVAPGGTTLSNVLTTADITIAAAGSGYHTNSIGIVTSSAGGGAVVSIGVDGTTGSITNVLVVNGGANYSTNGTIVIADLGNYFFNNGTLNVVDGVVDSTASNGTVPNYVRGSAIAINPSTGQAYRQKLDGSQTAIRTFEIISEVDNNALLKFMTHGGETQIGAIGIFPTNRQMALGTDANKKLLIGPFRVEPEVANNLSLGQSARPFYQGYFGNTVYASDFYATNGITVGLQYLTNLVGTGLTNDAGTLKTVGGTVKVDGVDVSSPDFGDTTYIDIDSTFPPSVTAELVIGTLISNVFVQGANMTLDKSSGTSIVFTATGGGGATNGTAVYDGDTQLNSVELTDSSEIDVTVSGTNATWAIVANSIATNKINSTFWNWIDGKTSITNLADLADVATTTPAQYEVLLRDASQWTNGLLSTNSISAAFYAFITNQNSGGTSYTFTNGVTNVSGVVHGNYLPGSNISFSTNAGAVSISATVAGGTGAAVTVDGGADNTRVNLADGGGIGFTLTGTNVTADVEANAVALATDTTGNYVATVAGTASKIDVSGSGSENAAVTVTLSDTIDIGGHTSLEIPNAAAPTTDAFGEIAGDNNAWAASRGAVQWFDGTANTWLVGVLSSDTPSNGQVPKWNTGGTITWEDDSTGGGGGGTTFVSGTPVTNANFVSSANATVSTASVTNVTYTFTGVGSATNGYLLKSATQLTNLSNDGEFEVFTVTIPSGTLSENGDELEIFVPGKFLNNSGADSGYTWRLNFGIASVHLNGALTNDFPSVSSARATEWRFRFKRQTATVVQSYVTHIIGTDSAAYVGTNAVVTSAYDESETVDDLSTTALDITFTVQNQSAHASLGHTFFGYTILKPGSAGGSGGTGDVVGPASATDNAIALFDTTTGKLIQSSSITSADGSSMSIPGNLTVDGTNQINTLSAGSLILTNPVDVASGGTGYTNLQTSLNVHSSPSNFVANPLVSPYQLITATNDVSFIHFTNAAVGRSLTVLIDANGANRGLSIPSTWFRRSVETVVTNGTFGALALYCYGTDNTNVIASYSWFTK